MSTGNRIEIIYIYDYHDNTYLALNITNQTSTGWYSDYNKVVDLSLNTSRPMEGNFSAASNLSLAELTDYLNNRDEVFKIHDIYIQEQSYEYW